VNKYSLNQLGSWATPSRRSKCRSRKGLNSTKLKKPNNTIFATCVHYDLFLKPKEIRRESAFLPAALKGPVAFYVQVYVYECCPVTPRDGAQLFAPRESVSRFCSGARTSSSHRKWTKKREKQDSCHKIGVQEYPNKKD
jgi:hypothetical protein